MGRADQCDSGMLDSSLPHKSFSSLQCNCIACKRGHANSPTAKLDSITPLKCLNIPQWELLVFPKYLITSVDKWGSFRSLFLFSQEI